MSSPAHRYAADWQRARQAATPLGRFQALYDFEFDPFQVQACQALQEGLQVLVAAPTGSGKTLVGEFAVHLALQHGRKCFYTTPIKALSNQKYRDLLARYGPETVGLLTGDTSLNGEAPVVVMTTEVLRNMLYEQSSTLAGLGFVVMDEVHYLADRNRGAVWEEVILHLPESVQMACLSATVSNVEEFGAWITSVRGHTTVVVEEHRPVPLWQHVQVGTAIYDLFHSDQAPVAAGVAPPVNPHLLGVIAGLEQRVHDQADASAAHRRGRRGRPYAGAGRSRWANPATRPPGRANTVEMLDRQGLLPAIVFIFSRAGCEQAVAQCLARDVRLTTSQQAQQILHTASQLCADLPAAEREVLGYAQWLQALQRGVAAHHAGLLPVFKQVVEQLFTQGLIQVVFATETLALGINMPARSVVIERLTKFNGVDHVDLTPGEYTQLTGRAGRRGIDVEGHAVVQWAPGISAHAVAGLASTRTYPLRSSFAPSANMAVNLLGRMSQAQAGQLLHSCFAQFQADQQVAGLARQVKALRAQAEKFEQGLHCDQPGEQPGQPHCRREDLIDYARVRQQWQRADKTARLDQRSSQRDEVEQALRALRPGEVVSISRGRRPGLAVVVQPAAPEPDQPARPLVVMANRQARRLSVVDFDASAVPVVGRVRVPKHLNPRNPAHRRDLASTLRASGLEPAANPSTPSSEKSLPSNKISPDQWDGARPGPPRGSSVHAQADYWQQQVQAHRCHHCPQRRSHVRATQRYHALHREIDTLVGRMNRDTGSIATQFERICALLTDLGYLKQHRSQLRVTIEGARLARLYGENDLLVAHCLREGTWHGLDAAALAACVSAMVYQSRRESEEQVMLPEGPARAALAQTLRQWQWLHEQEQAHGVDLLPQPDVGFAWAVHAWAGGAQLREVLEESELAAGDFVRWVKQIIDALDQIVHACAPTGQADVPEHIREVRVIAEQAVHAIRRGIITWGERG